MSGFQPSADHHYHFVTGRLAEGAVRSIVAELSGEHGFAFSVGVMPITVAALMTPKWLLRRLEVPDAATHVVFPGYCQPESESLQQAVKVPVLFGPKDCRALPQWFGGRDVKPTLDRWTTEIIAEINHVPRHSVDQVVAIARRLQRDGADMIDLGCDPNRRCREIGDYVAAVTDLGIRVSVDSFDPAEVADAVRRGASLVLSVNSSNAAVAPDWGCEVVVIPDTPDDTPSLHRTVDFLTSRDVSVRLDPILEPLGGGFVNSLIRYAKTRAEFPDAAMMMGIGNVTELTDVDSAGVNMLLMGVCEELGIGSVLTTQVINWGRTSVRECDLARRLAHYSVANGVPPKRISDQLITLRDDRLRSFSEDAIASLAAQIKDHNYRLIAQAGEIHVLSAGNHLRGDDPFALFEQMTAVADRPIDPGHAFYLGYEMAKASIALHLDKQYEQDEALDWGYLTKTEDLHRLARKRPQKD